MRRAAKVSAMQRLDVSIWCVATQAKLHFTYSPGDFREAIVLRPLSYSLAAPFRTVRVALMSTSALMRSDAYQGGESAARY